MKKRSLCVLVCFLIIFSFVAISRSIIAETNVVTDTFTRTVSSGWGSATSGQSYTTTGGTSTDYNVNGSAGTILTSTASASRETILSSLSITDSSTIVKVKANDAPVGGSPEVQVIARRVASNTNYRIRLIFSSGGTMNLVATRNVSGVTSTIGSQANIAITPTANQYYWFKAEASGTNPTTIRSKIWVDGDTEPGSWQFSTTDSQAELQVAAAMGIRTNVPAGVTSLPWTFSFDSLEISDLTASPSPSASASPSSTPVPSSLPDAGYTSSDFIQAQGKNLVYKGQTIHLQGTNFDNVPALGASVGSGNMSDIQIHEEDYQELYNKGGNHARFGLSFNWYKNDRNAFFTMLDQHVTWAKTHHIWLVLNMFTTPGDCYEGYSTQCGIWSSSSEQQELEDFWVDVASRYKHEPVVAGYDLLNEPTPPAPNYCSTWFTLASTIRDAVYAVAPNQLVFISSCSDPGNALRYRNPPFATNIVYEVHDYTPSELTHNSSLTYPGTATDWYNTCTYNKNTFQGIAEAGDPAGCASHTNLYTTYGLDWANTNNVPIYIGEWGATSSLNGYAQFHQDKAELYQDWGVNSAHYTWKHRTIVTGGTNQWGIYSNVLNLDDPNKLAAVQVSWEGAVFPDFTVSVSSSSSTASNSESNNSSVCTDNITTGRPDLFQITRTGTSAKLYFAPINIKADSYSVIYGYKEGDERFGGTNMMAMNNNQGVQSMVINYLNPSAIYYFKIIPKVGCAFGQWSNWLKAGKVTGRNSIFYRSI